VTTEFRLLTYCRDQHPPCAGVLIGDRVFPVAALLDGADGIDASSVLALLRTWEPVHRRLHEIAQRTLQLTDSRLTRSDCWRRSAIRAPCSVPARTTGTISGDGRDRPPHHRQDPLNGKAPGAPVLPQDRGGFDHRHRPDPPAVVLPTGRLGGGTGGRHRARGARSAGKRRLRSGRRLCHRQRPVGTRSDEARGHAVCLQLGRPEVLSRCGLHEALSDASCLCARSRPNGHQAMGQR
jgi:hypothetical protein